MAPRVGQLSQHVRVGVDRPLAAAGAAGRRLEAAR
eukprot:CAMPEP_0197527198 /NCGR_PEP_ID=MMETSP1318-20131121/20661_1 /TAXON_ID=552666 /ORGANISM="Partenskyella glossopodia, Strain RCC365" /LENGTH=34 /DNA_ID= /DNA_START= /DNA_END= /DNA_ORIENTATION=